MYQLQKSLKKVVRCLRCPLFPHISCTSCKPFRGHVFILFSEYYSYTTTLKQHENCKHELYNTGQKQGGKEEVVGYVTQL